MRVPAAERDGHDPDAGLDEPPGHQEVVHAAGRTVGLVLHVADAVAFAEPRVFLRDVEGVEHPARGEDLEGALGERIHPVDASSSTLRRQLVELPSSDRRPESRSAVMTFSSRLRPADPVGS